MLDTQHHYGKSRISRYIDEIEAPVEIYKSRQVPAYCYYQIAVYKEQR